jgi:hypothetical protein
MKARRIESLFLIEKHEKAKQECLDIHNYLCELWRRL